MRYTVFIILTVLVGSYAEAQVVVKPDSRPVYIRIESQPAQQSQEVTAPRVQLGVEASQVATLQREIAELKKEVEFLKASKQVELFAVEPPEDVMPKFAPYPSKPARRLWDMGGISQTNANLIKHLMGEIGSPQHGGKFNRDYLNYLATLPDGNAKLRALHSDDHDNVVRWGYVGGEPEPIVSVPASQPAYCPQGGNCPNMKWIRKR